MLLKGCVLEWTSDKWKPDTTVKWSYMYRHLINNFDPSCQYALVDKSSWKQKGYKYLNNVFMFFGHFLTLQW